MQGLPRGLACFVNAGLPRDLTSALTAARIGEANGYRTDELPLPVSQPTSLCASADHAKDNELYEMKQQIKTLTDIVSGLAVKSDIATTAVGQAPRVQQQSRRPNQLQPPSQQQHQGQPPQTRERTCCACHGEGHLRRNYYWNGVGEYAPTLKCQLCFQFGHPAPMCRLFLNGQNDGN